MPIRAAIFDLDDTLYLERDYVRSGYAAIAEYLSEPRPAGSGLAVSGEPRPAGSGLCISGEPRPEGSGLGISGEPRLEGSGLRRAEEIEQWLWARFQRGQSDGAFDAMNAEFSLGLSKSDIAGLVKVYREHRPTITPIPGIPELLSLLRPQFALGLLADGFLPAQQLKLAALELERFFDAVVFTEELGRDKWKPSPAGFEVMMEKIGAAQKGTVLVFPNSVLPQTEAGKTGTVPFSYISDNPSKDFLAPNRLGWRTIQLLYPGQVHAHLPAPEGGRPQFTARTPGDVIQILKQ